MMLFCVCFIRRLRRYTYVNEQINNILRIVLVSLFVNFNLMVFLGLAYTQDFREEAKRHYEIGNLYYQQGKYKEANEEFQKAWYLLSQREEGAVAETKIEPLIIEEDANSQSGMVKTDTTQEKKYTSSHNEQMLEYIIGNGDVLAISVWQNPDLDQELIVRPDGKISFPLIGDIQASGLSITQLDQEITERLKEYIKFPEVSISIKKLGGKKVIILGQVKNPGVYSVTGAKTILEAIGLAGGFTEHSVSSSVILIRGGFQSPRAKRINLSRALNRGDMHQNVTLESEDIVFVPKKFIANLNYFLNQILEPVSRGIYTAKEIRNW